MDNNLCARLEKKGERALRTMGRNLLIIDDRVCYKDKKKVRRSIKMSISRGLSD